MDALNDSVITKIKEELKPGEEIYLVGGSVRDTFLGKQLTDFDFACPNGIQFGRRIANKYNFGFFILDKDYDACRVIRTTDEGLKIHYDFNGYRKDTLTNDLFDRDFTINSIAIDLVTDRLVDPTGGLKDIREKILRLSSASSLESDPVRILRAIRFATSFGFRMDKGVIEAIHACKHKLNEVSAERIRDEVFKIFDGPKPHTALALFDSFGLIPMVFPDLVDLKAVEQSAPHINDVWTHTLNVVKHTQEIVSLSADTYVEERANADLFSGLLVLKLGRFREHLRKHFLEGRSEGRSKKANLLFAALYHDVNKPEAKTIEESGRIRFIGHDVLSAITVKEQGETFRLSTVEVEAVGKIVKNHMRIHSMVSRRDAGMELTPKAIYRFFKNCGEEGVDLVLLSLADTRATFEHTLKQETWRNALDVSAELLEAWFEKKEQLVSPAAIINGNDLMTILTISPGPIIGEILEKIRENQVSGTLSTKDEALAFAEFYIQQKSNSGSENSK